MPDDPQRDVPVSKCKRVAHAGKISGMNDIAMAKAQLREEILFQRKRQQVSANARLELSQNILMLVERLTPNRVAIYSSYPSEPDTSMAIEALVTKSIPVLVPETHSDGSLSWHELSSHVQVSLQNDDLLLIPALAVDLGGNRLGRGKGYFDRELEKVLTKKVYAVVFESEILTKVPVESHDRRVSGVVTEAGIRDLN